MVVGKGHRQIMRDHNINQGSSSSLISIEMEVTAEALNSPLQGSSKLS